jgi:hypothetical protein
MCDEIERPTRRSDTPPSADGFFQRFAPGVQYTTVTADHVVSKHGATKSDPTNLGHAGGGAKPSTEEVRGRAQRAEGLGPPKLV